MSVSCYYAFGYFFYLFFILFFFFFSSRRRHTRLVSDWSSDVCSSDLNGFYGSDGRDETVVDAPFAWHPAVPLSRLRIGFVAQEFEGTLADLTGSPRVQIGRASCRERVEISVVDGDIKEKLDRVKMDKV